MNIESKIEAGDSDACSYEITGSLEEIVLKWSATINSVLNEKSDQICGEKKYPTPTDEFEFWNSRFENLKNIYDQLCDERIKTIAMILEQKESVYFQAFRTLFQGVVDNLQETKDVSLFLKPLVNCEHNKENVFFSEDIIADSFGFQQIHVQRFETTDFGDSKELIRPLMHIMCLVWANSKYYCTNDRIVHMLKLLHNQMIEDAKTSLDPGSIFQGEPDEALSTIKIIIDIFQYYKYICRFLTRCCFFAPVVSNTYLIR